MAFENQSIDRELSWDDTISKDSAEFEILPEGDYIFFVDNFERGRHPGSEKLPACNKAILTLKLRSDIGDIEGTIKHNLFLHTKCEGLLCAFFSAIGQRKKGDPLRMDWSKVIGASGRCRIDTRKYIKKDGTEGTLNEVKKFYAPDEDSKTKASRPKDGEF